MTGQKLASEMEADDAKASAHEPSYFKVNAVANIKTRTVFIQSLTDTVRLLIARVVIKSRSPFWMTL